jgi:negative regulator of sigma E activity
MSEQEQISQLSALFDGELPSQQADMVIRRVSRDLAMRQRWQHYAVIGACMRGEPLAGAGTAANLAERVSASIAAEAEILAPWGARASSGAAAGCGFVRVLGRGAMGGAIAAAVAVMAVVVVRFTGSAAGTTEAVDLVAQVEPVAAAPTQFAAATPVEEDSQLPSYTTPGENSALPSLLPNQAPLAHYVVAHSEQAASSLGFSYDLTEGAVVMSDEEVAARLR